VTFVYNLVSAEKRIAELEKQLDEEKQAHKRNVIAATEGAHSLKVKRVEAEKREAVLRLDKERLDFITEQTYSISRITLDEEIHWDVLEVGACKCMGRGKTPREAIDKAMEGE